MALLSMQDIARQIPEYSIFTAGYLIRDPITSRKSTAGRSARKAGKRIAEAMDIQLLQAVYLARGSEASLSRGGLGLRPISPG